MNIEIERKFLVRDDSWKTLGQGVLIRQGYLSSHCDRIVRVRIEGEISIITIKGRASGISRAEWEYPIPMEDAQIFLSDLCEKPIIEKYRYRIPHEGMIWEVDAFLGENAGLVVAEIELATEYQPFSRPDWVGDEVTGDSRYFNASLLHCPYSRW